MMECVLWFTLASLIKVILRLCFACSFFFVWGCGKPATSPVSNSGEVSVPKDGNSLELETSSDRLTSVTAEGLPSGLQLNGRVEWYHSQFTTLDGIVLPPKLRMLLVLDESNEREIVAYGNLRLSSSKTDSGRLKLAHGYPAERLASGLIPLDHFLLWKNRSRNETVIPIDFLYPLGDPKSLAELNGKLSLVTAGASSAETIFDLQSLIGNDTPNAKMPPNGVEIHLLPPEYEGASSSIALIFTSNAIISDAHVLDKKGNRLKETWAELSRLFDGRTRIVVASDIDPLTEEWHLQFMRHSELIQSEIDFDFRNLSISTLDQEVAEEQKRLVRWSQSSKKSGVPQDHHVEAKVRWSNITSIDENGNQNSKPLKIHVDIIGRRAAKTVGFGRLNVDSAVAAGEQLISIKEENATYSGPHDGVVAYDPLGFFPQAPVDGARVVFQFQPMRDGVRSIDELTGRCTLLTAKSQQSFIIEDIMQSLDQAIEHPVLKKHNITLIPEMFGSGLSIPVKAENVLAVQEIAAIDKSGGASRSVYCGRQQFNGRTVFSITGQSKLPEVIPVRITINEGLEEMTVPFSFKDLPIPLKPKDVNAPRLKIKSSSR